MKSVLLLLLLSVLCVTQIFAAKSPPAQNVKTAEKVVQKPPESIQKPVEQVHKPGAGKNILFFLGFTTYSHRVSMWPLVQKMADEGYNITFLSSHPPKTLADPRIHEYVPDSFVEMNAKMLSIDLLDMRLQGFHVAYGMWDAFPLVAVEMYQMLAKEPKFLNMFESSKFDLVFMDSLYCDFAMGLAYKFNSKLALFSTTVPYMWQSDLMGSPTESWIPDLQYALPEGSDQTFIERVVNVMKPIYWTLLRQWSYFPKLEKIFREDLGMTDMPPMEEIEKNVSLILANTHFSEEYGRSVPPNLISIGGMHCSPPKKNEDLGELGKFMDGSGKDGFIYFSLGSAAKVSNLPLSIRQDFFTAMRNAKTKFVLKWEGEVPKDLPKNVFTAEWFPQQTVLNHPRIKGFITHGGLLSVQEAVCAAVPMIFLGIFGEQDYNGNRFHKRGSGIKLSWNTVTLEKIEDALTKILTDPSYKKNMEKTSTLFLDRPQKPLETASYWVDYILRHPDVKSLQSLGVNQTWWERRLLDVWLFIFTILATVLFLLVKLLACLFCRRRTDKVDSKVSEKKKKR